MTSSSRSCESNPIGQTTELSKRLMQYRTYSVRFILYIHCGMSYQRLTGEWRLRRFVFILHLVNCQIMLFGLNYPKVQVFFITRPLRFPDILFQFIRYSLSFLSMFVLLFIHTYFFSVKGVHFQLHCLNSSLIVIHQYR